MAREFSMRNLNPKDFIAALDKCKGKVYLITADGDKFNLKSTLSQLAGIVKLIEGGVMVEANIVCDNPDDESLLFRLNLFGK